VSLFHSSSTLLKSRSHDNTRVLLATIRDKGLHPCPRCLVPKSKIDQTGTKRDTQFREKNGRKYLLDFVHLAWDAIYRRAAKIGGAVVNRLLKPTSSVPTIVSFLYVAVQQSDNSFGCNFRMHLSIGLGMILRSHGFLFWIYFMSLNWVFGKHSLHT
jgi:hypothetical protein